MLSHEDFWGFNYGIFLQANLFKTKFYVIIGVDYFNNVGTGHNTAFAGGDFAFISFGIGYSSSENFNIDITYHIPNKQKFGIDRAGDVSSYIWFDKIDYGLLKVGFQYSFIL